MFPLHEHPWGQLVYASSGTLQVIVNDTWYPITPEQAIWVPHGVRHATGALHDAEFRSLYVGPQVSFDTPKSCIMFAMTPLLRALILELEAAELRDEPADYVERIVGLALEQLHRLQPQKFSLPWPKSEDLCSICEELYEKPYDDRSIESWAAVVGVTPRTLARRFERDVGVSLRAWRHKLRLFRAIEWLRLGRSVTDVALSLGYASPSSFTFMFRREMGASPTDWMRNKDI